MKAVFKAGKVVVLAKPDVAMMTCYFSNERQFRDATDQLVTAAKST